jgi:mono/diheme cytochrome c family protein
VRPVLPTGVRLGLALLAWIGLVAVAACGPRGPLTPPESYDEYCARCHGDDGRGDPKMVRLKPELDLVRSEMVREGDLALVRRRIADGEGTMPGFEQKLSPEELEALTLWTVERFRKTSDE